MDYRKRVCFIAVSYLATPMTLTSQNVLGKSTKTAHVRVQLESSLEPPLSSCTGSGSPNRPHHHPPSRGTRTREEFRTGRCIRCILAGRPLGGLRCLFPSFESPPYAFPFPSLVFTPRLFLSFCQFSPIIPSRQGT